MSLLDGDLSSSKDPNYFKNHHILYPKSPKAEIENGKRKHIELSHNHRKKLTSCKKKLQTKEEPYVTQNFIQQAEKKKIADLTVQLSCLVLLKQKSKIDGAC